MKTVTFTAALCAPSRQALTGTVRQQLQPYGFRDVGIDATLVKQGNTPLWWLIRVTFTDRAAEWGEYVLLRWGYHRQGRCLNAQNIEWAERYLGQCPKGQRWGASCQDKPKGIPGEMPQANPPTPWKLREGQAWPRKSLWDKLKESI